MGLVICSRDRPLHLYQDLVRSVAALDMILPVAALDMILPNKNNPNVHHNKENLQIAACSYKGKLYSTENK